MHSRTKKKLVLAELIKNGVIITAFPRPFLLSSQPPSFTPPFPVAHLFPYLALSLPVLSLFSPFSSYPLNPLPSPVFSSSYPFPLSTPTLLLPSFPPPPLLVLDGAS